ncbi:MAG TPA: peptidylprolyl isomerase, partial [Brevundimonas sp.]
MRQVLGLAALSVLMAGAANAQDSGGTPPPPPPPTPATTVAAPEWRTATAENLLVIDTTKGRVIVELTPEVAPLHVERIKLLARQGFYDGVPWHRVIDWFMAQTGDPLGNGEGQSPYPDLKAE